MKFVLVQFLAVLFCYQFSSTEAAGVGWRSKRSLAREMCPTGSTEQECLKYANEQLVKNKSCAAFKLTSDKVIEWKFCGSASCRINGKEITMKEDLSKPYPDCCPKCEISNIKLSGSNTDIFVSGAQDVSISGITIG